MLFVILMTLAAGAQMAHAAKGGRSDFYQKYMSRPSEELIRIGKDYRLRKNKPDSALLFFTIVAGRYTPNMSAEEKREVVEALNMNYFIYSFTYLNYPKAYENLLRAHTISKELGETSAALYFNLGSMYQLVAGQGRQWKLYSKALDCYRKGVRLALAKKDMPTADMAFTNMTTLFFVIILLVVMRENRKLRRRNLALYHRSLEVLKSDEMAGKQRKTVSAPAVEENNAATASSKYHHSTLSDADKDRVSHNSCSRSWNRPRSSYSPTSRSKNWRKTSVRDKSMCRRSSTRPLSATSTRCSDATASVRLAAASTIRNAMEAIPSRASQGISGLSRDLILPPLSRSIRV